MRPNSSATAPQAPASRPATRKGLSAVVSPWSVFGTGRDQVLFSLKLTRSTAKVKFMQKERIEKDTFSDEVKEALQQKIYGGTRLPHASGSIVTYKWTQGAMTRQKHRGLHSVVGLAHTESLHLQTSSSIVAVIEHGSFLIQLKLNDSSALRLWVSPSMPGPRLCALSPFAGRARWPSNA